MKEAGIIPLHKPSGMTSHDCVVRLRRMLKTKRVGHTGTLDPAVSGVLPICINRATKVAEYMSAYNKTYKATVSLGTSTTTEDQTGEVLDQVPVDPSMFQDLDQTLNRFRGEIEQTPPMYSAVKVNGKRLYEYAREGIDVERPTRRVKIHSLELIGSLKKNEETGNIEFPIEVTCSKGTYIRTLAVDIGKAFGVPAHMSSLVRTKSGPFTLEQTVTFEQLEQRIEEKEGLGPYLKPIEMALSLFPSVVVSEETERQILNGALLKETKELSNERTAVYNGRGECLAIYKPHPERPGWVKPEKVLKIQE
ncbi:tRNA pseudouridine(55) synthase TruB [Pseudalkalibacillus sp. SCS-8]|uniref:tRNA pseudouridine(55) synthase TruB n=1 Tax=Pseudalkalibacillus nanhaiensis TaxID=3115291 RepID=UPI0032DABEA4